VSGFVQAVALDLDGTITRDGMVCGEALAAVKEARDDGLMVVLVTGRILSELQADFGDLTDRFDAVVAENGTVLLIGDTVRDLVSPVDAALATALRDRGVPVRSGRVLLACAGEHADVVTRETEQLGLDAQLLHNRGELMVLPAGASKGTGLVAALGELGLSPHNAIAIGDAENDLALLETAELGIAVANAVPSLRARADMTLSQSYGAGVAEVLSGPLVRGRTPVRPERRQIEIGRFLEGDPALVPAAQTNILVCGSSGSGKSHLAGLLVEQWITAGYSVLVVDLEGDHIGLGHLSNVVVLGGERLPGGHELMALLRQPGLSVVLDLSRRGPERLDYLRAVSAAVEAERAVHGVPHWIVIDEAHQTLGEHGATVDQFRPADLGYCLVTYLPKHLSTTARTAMERVITMKAGLSGDDGVGGGTAGLRVGDGPERLFTVAARRTPHRRHWHKYSDAPLPPDRWFRFHGPSGSGSVVARDLAEFLAVLRTVDPSTTEFHLLRGDFSRWLLGTLRERALGAATAAVERDLLARRAGDVERAREHVVAEIDAHFTDRLKRDCREPPPLSSGLS
jgi:hydroxymethylpyrimidine pyrophosphatase-like HAD family hydrolase